jgi:ferredoxin-NADP reductase
VPLNRKVRCTVKRIDNHGEAVYTLELAPEKEIPAFHPGQFLHLALDAYDPSGFWPDSRAFSIASSPSDRSQLKISYSVKGKFTARMEKELRQGTQVWVKLPYGDFLVNDTKEVVLIAGGTGITAFSAFLDGLKPETKQEISLFYGARSEKLLIYREMLYKVARTIPNFHLYYALESAPQSSANPGFQAHIGQLDIDWIWLNIPAPVQAVYFLSGPPIMLKCFSNDLGSRGVPSENIRIDAWE